MQTSLAFCVESSNGVILNGVILVEMLFQNANATVAAKPSLHVAGESRVHLLEQGLMGGNHGQTSGWMRAWFNAPGAARLYHSVFFRVNRLVTALRRRIRRTATQTC